MTAFADQVAVITGASSGMGQAIALGLAAQGAALGLVGRRLEALEAVAERGRALTSPVVCYRVDLTLDDDIRKLVACLLEDFGRVDILVHSAGAFAQGQLEMAPVEEFDGLYRTNVRAPYLLTQLLAPLLKARRGQIVFINSSVALMTARANGGPYAATKYALKAIADSLRAEINADGVRVLSVYPGRTAGPMQAAIHQMEGKVYYPERLMQPEDVATVVINALGLPRSAEVTDISLRPLHKSEG
jgi:NADP-dependent 3-hydroxy acid dehydrogenase YdfG